MCGISKKQKWGWGNIRGPGRLLLSWHPKLCLKAAANPQAQKKEPWSSKGVTGVCVGSGGHWHGQSLECDKWCSHKSTLERQVEAKSL